MAASLAAEATPRLYCASAARRAFMLTTMSARRRRLETNDVTHPATGVVLRVLPMSDGSFILDLPPGQQWTVTASPPGLRDATRLSITPEDGGAARPGAVTGAGAGGDPTRTGAPDADQSPRPTTSPRAYHEQAATIRAWARANGYPVISRGRIPNAVADAYDAAHPPATDDDGAR